MGHVRTRISTGLESPRKVVPWNAAFRAANIPFGQRRDSRTILDATNNTIFLKFSNGLSKNKRERKIFFGFKKTVLYKQGSAGAI